MAKNTKEAIGNTAETKKEVKVKKTSITKTKKNAEVEISEEVKPKRTYTKKAKKIEPIVDVVEEPKLPKRTASKKNEIVSLFEEVLAIDSEIKEKKIHTKKIAKIAEERVVEKPTPPIKKTKGATPRKHKSEDVIQLEINNIVATRKNVPQKKHISEKTEKINAKSNNDTIISMQASGNMDDIVSQLEISATVVDIVDKIAKPLSKSAKRRARKKAKKQKDMKQQQLADTVVEEKKDIVNNKNLSAKAKNNLQPTSISIDDLLKAEIEPQAKKHPDKIKRDLPPQKLIGTKSVEKSEKSDMPYEYKEQSNRNDEIRNIPFSKSIKPIPFVDLQKIKDNRKIVERNTDVEIVPINSAMLLSPIERKEPFFQNFYRQVEKFVITEMLVEKGSKVVVAVSGGVDSVVMLDIMANLSDRYHFVVYVAHYNHNLRGTASDNDAAFVKELATLYNVPFYTANGKVEQYAEKNDMSIEESARFLRYFFFERTTRTIKADFLATAHNLEDSAETFLLNLLRGTGLTGLSGIPAKRQFIKDVILIRPLLTIHKSQIKEYATKRGLKWNEDETNMQTKHTRNRIRLDLLPKLAKDYSPSIIDIINRSSKLIQGADRIIHDYVRTHLASILFDISNDSVSIKVSLFRTFDEFIRGEMLQTILMKYFRMMPPPMKIIDRILRLVDSDTGAVCELSMTIMAVRDRNSIVITKKQTPINIDEKISKTGKFQIGNITFVLKMVSREELEYTSNPKVEYLDYDHISEVLTVRNWKYEDVINPLGMVGTMKVSDFLLNEKVPVLEKPNVLVLVNSNSEVIWVCKYRISDKYKVTDETKNILKMEIKEKLK